MARGVKPGKLSFQKMYIQALYRVNFKKWKPIQKLKIDYLAGKRYDFYIKTDKNN